MSFGRRTMISEELLKILVCPETKQPLSLVDDDLLKKINKAIHQGKVVNRDGNPVNESLDGGLIREDKKIVYPIIKDLPFLRIGDGIELEKNRIS
ncbi:MAG: hypothetical protein LDL53_05535 [Candidatus Hydrogenedens sp.]|nr:hypothetical protein [Candidatus Hydrogenedens sp.]